MERALILLTILSVSTLPSVAAERPAGDDLAAYLHETGLSMLYVTELRNRCLEGPDLTACREYLSYLGEQHSHDHAASFIDSVGDSRDRAAPSMQLLKAEALFNSSRFEEAADLLDSLIDALPPKRILLEATLLRAKTDYRLGNKDEALMNLRSLRAHLEPSVHPDLALWSARCEEDVGDLGKARELYEQAWKHELPEAAVGLMRVSLKQGDGGAFFEISDEVSNRGVTLPSQAACELAVTVGDLVPGACHALMAHALADTNFDIEVCPKIVRTLVKMGESYEPIEPYCEALLARDLPPDVEEKLRYAHAFASGQPETVLTVLRGLSDPYLKLRGTILYLTESMASASQPVPDDLIAEIVASASRLAPHELFDVCEVLVRQGRGELVTDYLTKMRRDLDVDFDQAAVLGLAGLLARAGAKEAALEMYRDLEASNSPSLICLQAGQEALKLSQPDRTQEDIAGDLERVAAEDISDVELGDLFVERFGDYRRAARYYRRALTSGDEQVGFDRLRLKLATALAQAWFQSGQGERTGQRSSDGRLEALDTIVALAESKTVSPHELVSALTLATGFLSLDHETARDGIYEISLRDDLEAGDIYELAKVLYYLHLLGDTEAGQECKSLIERLANDFPSAEEAGLGILLDASMKFDAGDYVGALDRYNLSAKRWPDGPTADICNAGIGSCYLYSGGLSKAVTYLTLAGDSPALSYMVARCYEALGEPDSAKMYYGRVLEKLSVEDAVTDGARLRLGLIALRTDGLDAAMQLLDSPVPPPRQTVAFGNDPPRLDVVERLVEAYGLAESGYKGLGVLYLRLHWEGHMFPCDARLMASDLITVAYPDSALMVLPSEAYCFDIFGAFDLLHDRAKYACASDDPGRCARHRQRFEKRFPLAQAGRLELDLRSLIQMFREGEGDTASVILDSLLTSGIEHPLLEDLLYRRGVYRMVERDFAGAIADLRLIEQAGESSDLYHDACFKLGTAYYITERYDSSATYFMMASGASKVSLVENALFNGGLALEKAGDLAGAAEAFWKLATMFPFSERFGRSLMRSAYALERSGKAGRAVRLYRGLLQYAETAETAAEATYWIGESYSAMGDHLRAAVEFLRVAHLFPQEAAWAGTATFQAGIECERAGLVDYATIVYRENVRRFGDGTDWGSASQERLAELEAESQRDEPDGSEQNGQVTK